MATVSCWNAFCVAENDTSNPDPSFETDHVDVTGDSWSQEPGTQYCPVCRDYVDPNEHDHAEMRMFMDPFWTAIEAQLTLLEQARTADDVIRILRSDAGSGDAFFAGSGGDGSVEGALDKAGWVHVWREAHYFYCMRADDGSMITYIEGDVYTGNRPPLSES